MTGGQAARQVLVEQGDALSGELLGRLGGEDPALVPARLRSASAVQ